MSALPQSRQAVLTALYRDPAFVSQPYWGTLPLYSHLQSNGAVPDVVTLLILHCTETYISHYFQVMYPRYGSACLTGINVR